MATIFEKEGFDAAAAASILKKALDSAEGKEATIIDVLANHTYSQRMKIALVYETAYGKDLFEGLKSGLSGDFGNAVVAMVTDTTLLEARELKKAMKGFGTDEKALIQILCTNTSSAINKIKNAYSDEYGTELEADVIGETSGDFQKLLVSQLQATRDESSDVDENQVESDAQDIVDAGIGSFDAEENVFHKVLFSRNWLQLRATLKAYECKTGKDIEEVIASKTSGDLQDGYLTLVKYAKDAENYFAEKLYECMKGLGTDDNMLIRIMVGRSENNLLDIQKRFLEKYGQTLEEFIEGDCSGDYQLLLKAILRRD